MTRTWEYQLFLQFVQVHTKISYTQKFSGVILIYPEACPLALLGTATSNLLGDSVPEGRGVTVAAVRAETHATHSRQTALTHSLVAVVVLTSTAGVK